jgi:hypothetical protein
MDDLIRVIIHASGEPILAPRGAFAKVEGSLLAADVGRILAARRLPTSMSDD